MGFDLATLDVSADQGVPMTVYHPVTNQPLTDKDGNEVTITLLGMDSKVYREVQRANTNRRLANMRGGRGAKLTAEELEAEKINLLVKCTVSWSGIDYQGKPLECTPQNVRKLYEELPWLRDQVDEFIADRANFLTSSSQDS